MKLSSLNQFRKKRVFVTYVDEKLCFRKIEGVVDDVELSGLTIKIINGLKQIPIEDLRDIIII